MRFAIVAAALLAGCDDGSDGVTRTPDRRSYPLAPELTFSDDACFVEIADELTVRIHRDVDGCDVSRCDVLVPQDATNVEVSISRNEDASANISILWSEDCPPIVELEFNPRRETRALVPIPPIAVDAGALLVSIDWVGEGEQRVAFQFFAGAR